MKMTEAAIRNHDKMFPNHLSTLRQTDPELTGVYDNFAFNEITRKGEPEKGSVISQKSLAAFIATLINSPEKYIRENLGINKPNS